VRIVVHDMRAEGTSETCPYRTGIGPVQEAELSGVRWTKWDPEAVKAATLAEVAENAEVVGEFVETEARRRLDTIRTPDNKRARAWRAFLSRWVLTNTVATEPNAVVITVGMKRGPRKGGNTRGFYVETGSSTAPAHPYLRPAVFQNARRIVELLAGK